MRTLSAADARYALFSRARWYSCPASPLVWSISDAERIFKITKFGAFEIRKVIIIADPNGIRYLSGDVLLSQDPAVQVPSALEGLTVVFGMGTGVSPPPSSPSNVILPCISSGVKPSIITFHFARTCLTCSTITLITATIGTARTKPATPPISPANMTAKRIKSG